MPPPLTVVISDPEKRRQEEGANAMRRSEAGVLILVGKNPAVVATPGTRLKHAKKPLDWKPEEEKGLVITDDYWDIFQFGPEELQKMDEMVEEKKQG